MNRRPVSPAGHNEPRNELGDLERAKRESIGQLLFKCARLFNERAIDRVNERAVYPVLRPAHTNLFPHIAFEGTRLVELARKLGISKQAVGQTVAELEQLGVVETLSDASDARAKLVRFTAKGKSAIAHGLEVLREIENELEPRVGEPTMTSLHDALLALESALTADGLTAPQPKSHGNRVLNDASPRTPKNRERQARKR